jgi:large-conductance mechanosensitive channel
MYISKYNNNKQCAVFGLKIKERESEWDSKPNFIKTYHKHGNILNYKWTMKYETDDEGTLVVGDSPVNYDPSFKNKNYIEYSTIGVEKNGLPAFGITFDEITVNNTVLNTNLRVYFYHEYNAIIVTTYYIDKLKEEFFKDYFNKSICKQKFEYGKYGCIYCYKNFTEEDMKSFPTIYFKSVDLNYIFELNYKDLFTEEKDGNLYFLMITEINGDNLIKFGKPFLKKYTFIVDNENNKISTFAIGEEKKKPLSITILIIIISAISFVFILAIIFLVYKLLTKKGKKRANELDDEYEYMTKEEENKDNSNDPQIPLANNLGV